MRYEREALALQKIIPEVEITLLDAAFYFFVGVLKDLKHAILTRCLSRQVLSILMFRSAQFYGTYRGSYRAGEITKELKLQYFYPRVRKVKLKKDSD